MANTRNNNYSDQPAGELRHRATFLQRMVTVKSGISKETWQPLFTCWCKVEPLAGKEFWNAAALNREQEMRFTIRFRQDVSPALRILWNGVQYEITSAVNPGARNIRLELLAKSVLPVMEV